MRALLDAPDVVDGVFLDAMAMPRSFDDSCILSGGCTAEKARRLAAVTSKLIQKSTRRSGKASATATVAAPSKAGAAALPTSHLLVLPWPSTSGLMRAAAILVSIGASATLSVVAALAMRSRQMRLRMLTKCPPCRAPRLPPGPLLNKMNQLVHLPLVAPLLEGLYWGALCLAAAALAPVAVILGLLKAAREAACTIGGTLEAPPSERSKLGVVITGCDSGFGRALALELAGRGYSVFACCLSAAASTTLQEEWERVSSGHTGDNSMALLRVTVMDVTVESEVNAAATLVHKWTEAMPNRRVLAVVNNAGIGHGGYVEWLQVRGCDANAQSARRCPAV